MAVQLIAVCAAGCGNRGCEHILQEYSIPTAESKYNSWTAEEIDFIQGTLNESLSTVALVLGRTYYATARARSLVTRGLLRS